MCATGHCHLHFTTAGQFCMLLRTWGDWNAAGCDVVLRSQLLLLGVPSAKCPRLADSASSSSLPCGAPLCTCIHAVYFFICSPLRKAWIASSFGLPWITVPWTRLQRNTLRCFCGSGTDGHEVCSHQHRPWRSECRPTWLNPMSTPLQSPLLTWACDVFSGVWVLASHCHRCLHFSED